MKISTKGRYALRLMLDIAQHDNGEPVSLRDISRRQEISIKYLEQIVSTLAHAGLLRSIRGPQGGYLLARKPDAYTAEEILRLVEGDLHPVECLKTAPNGCPRADSCATLRLWQELDEAIDGVLSRWTLEDLLRQSEEQADNYVI